VSVLLGTHFHPGDAGALERQSCAMDALGELHNVAAIDLQWAAGPDKRPWIRTLPLLRQDSTTITGRTGRQKPVAREVFDVLADLAGQGGHRYFLFFNSDIVVTQAAVDRIIREGREAYAFSRLDMGGPDAAAPTIMTYGLDAFAFDVGWWRANRRRFRPYILGEALWDNVYAAVFMAHGKGVIENRHGEVRHERHPRAWSGSPFAEYNGFLAALDGRYFSLWVHYHDALLAARQRGASDTDERTLADDQFAWRPSIAAACRQVVTDARARVRYRIAGWRETAG
jgi:hypothetical protein